MKKLFVFLFLGFVSLYGDLYESFDQNNPSLIRNHQTINQWTQAILAHKQAVSDSTASIYTHNQMLQKNHHSLQTHQDFIKNINQLLEKNIHLLESTTQTMTENAEATYEVQKMFLLLKKLPWILGIFFILLLLPSLIMLWALFNLKKTLKK